MVADFGLAWVGAGMATRASVVEGEVMVECKTEDGSVGMM